MRLTFGVQLKQFALSISAVDEPTLHTIFRAVEEYTQKSLDINITRLYLPVSVEEQPGLHAHTLADYGIAQNSFRIRNDVGKPYNQISLAYDLCEPLWIVSAEGKQRLAGCGAYRDLWSDRRAIPPYSSVETDGSDNMLTAILLPICYRQEFFGVLGLFTDEYLDITTDAKVELRTIADTIGIIFNLYHLHHRQFEDTTVAIDNIRAILAQPLPRLTKPAIFLASSSRAYGDVIALVRAVLDEYADKLELVYWKEMDAPGNINAQLLEAVSRCRYGICYFSEPVEDATPADEVQFFDNANVVFEAGMFQGRRNQPLDTPTRWIPIRESASHPLPFDFAQERMVHVERHGNGTIKRPGVLKNTLRRLLNTMLHLDELAEK